MARSTARHVPTLETRLQVESYAGVGLPHEQIGRLLGITEKTLRKHYRLELDVGEAKANATVAKTLFHQATKGKSVAAMIFWLKARAGWREKQDVTVRGGKPLEEMTEEELRAVAEGRA